MAAIEPKEMEEDAITEVAIDLTDPNSVAENLDSLSEEQIEELLQKALDINKKLKGCLQKEERRKVKFDEGKSGDVPNSDHQTDQTPRTLLPPIQKSTSLVGSGEVMKDLRHLHGDRKSAVNLKSQH